MDGALYVETFLRVRLPTEGGSGDCRPRSKRIEADGDLNGADMEREEALGLASGCFLAKQLEFPVEIGHCNQGNGASVDEDFECAEHLVTFLSPSVWMARATIQPLGMVVNIHMDG